jgi:hypothetical protein
MAESRPGISGLQAGEDVNYVPIVLIQGFCLGFALRVLNRIKESGIARPSITMKKDFFFRFRVKTFHWVCDFFSLPEGKLLPKWAICAKFVLFPVEMLGWALTRPNHYDLLSDSYTIYGIKYDGSFFRCLAADSECVYRFRREGDLVVAERISFPKLEG